ncbi:MAG: hypothetical protein E2598_04555 [Sphingobium sp.]|nr:hypothetical protein [Sphingobium sp.]
MTEERAGYWGRLKRGGNWLGQRLLRKESVTLLRLEGDGLIRHLEVMGDPCPEGCGASSKA